jgi:hypothetical protein
MKRISCKKLAETLNAQFSMDLTGKQLQSKCEAYGKDVRCYLPICKPKKRQAIKTFLTNEGINWNRDYGMEKVIDIGVTYFKAWHWDE